MSPESGAFIKPSCCIVCKLKLSLDRLQEAEEAAAAEVLKLQQELEMEEAGLQPFPDVQNLESVEEVDNQELQQVPEMSEQQSYQFFVEKVKEAESDLDDANIVGAEHAE